jgi:hypothetical protein
MADVHFGLGFAGVQPIVGNWQGFTAPPLLAAGGALQAAFGVQPGGASLNAQAVSPILREAITRWAEAGVAIASPQVVVTDLPGALLGQVVDRTLYLDQDAAGRGWFVDPTPALDEEFAQLGGAGWQAVDAQAAERMDLLTVVEHELGHLAGLPDLDAAVDDLMSGLLAVGTRKGVQL